MKKLPKTPNFNFIISILALLFISSNASGQIFNNDNRGKYQWNIEGGYQTSHFESKNASPSLGGSSNGNGIFLIGRANSTVVYATFGKHTLQDTSKNFIMVGIESPAIPFRTSFGRTETGILVSVLSDYIKWERLSDDGEKRLDVSGFGLNVGAYFDYRASKIEVSGKLSAGYAYCYQYVSQQSGNQWIGRFVTNIIFPNVTEYFGISATIFANYSNFDFSNSDLKSTIMTTGFTGGIAF